MFVKLKASVLLEEFPHAALVSEYCRAFPELAAMTQAHPLLPGLPVLFEMPSQYVVAGVSVMADTSASYSYMVRPLIVWAVAVRTKDETDTAVLSVPTVPALSL